MKIAIVGSAVLVFAALIGAAAFGRYEISVGGNGGDVYRLDRLTGQVESYPGSIIDGYYSPSAMAASRSIPKWCKAPSR